MIETFSATLSPLEVNKQRESPYESLLSYVQRPSRYIGREWNSIVRSEEFRKMCVSVCLAFPDLYETGFANTGIEILYSLINQRKDAYAERLYAVDNDLAQLLRQKNLPLFSLETHTSILKFDILGFGLPYELCYTNILEMLDLSGMPLRSKFRDESYPLVIGGGPCAVNPEPLADFFDCIVLGDGEEAIVEIIEKFKEYKLLKYKKQDLFLELAKIKGVYVPSLYEVEYSPDQTIKKIFPKFSGIPEKISYRQTQIGTFQTNGFSFPIAPVVPFVQTVHDRLNVEIQRGCPWRCRFCQAGFTYHSYRERSKDELLEIIEKGLKNTGYDALTLAGLSSADYREIVPLLETLSQKLTSRRISIGLPSTRADRFTLALAEILQTVRRQSLTFAPEAGTERLRRVIRKELQESEIRATLKLAYQHGWKNIKLYFMYGLPTETKEDLEGIAQVVQHSRKENPGLSLTLTLSPFVPKPHTPYQWCSQDRQEILKSKLQFLRKNLPAKIRAHGLEQIELEGLLSRGDRRTSFLLETAWRLGAKFDEWSERFQNELWKKACEQTKIFPEFYCYRQRTVQEIFPWDHLEGGPDKKALWNDLQTAYHQAEVPVPLTPHLKPRPEIKTFSLSQKAQSFLDKTVQRVRFRLERKGLVRYLSHLEQVEMIRRTIRRAELPVCFSSGFHPQMKISFGPAISVGTESECEYFEADFYSKVNIEEVKKKFSSTLPNGFALLSVSPVPVFFPSLESLITRVDYEIRIPEELFVKKSQGENLELENFLNQPDLFLEKSKKGSQQMIQIPIKPLLLELAWLEGRQEKTLGLSLRFGPGKNIKPEQVVSLFLKLNPEESRSLLVKRKSFFVERFEGSYVEP